MFIILWAAASGVWSWSGTRQHFLPGPLAGKWIPGKPQGICSGRREQTVHCDTRQMTGTTWLKNIYSPSYLISTCSQTRLDAPLLLPPAFTYFEYAMGPLWLYPNDSGTTPYQCEPLYGNQNQTHGNILCLTCCEHAVGFLVLRLWKY